MRKYYENEKSETIYGRSDWDRMYFYDTDDGQIGVCLDHGMTKDTFLTLDEALKRFGMIGNLKDLNEVSEAYAE